MGRFVLTSLCCLVALVFVVRGQTCSSSLPNECYYTGAGTLSAGSSLPNKYFAIGGLFDIHKWSGERFCGNDVSTAGMMNLMAFYWSIDKFAALKLPNDMNIGAVAFDNCMRPDQTIENLLSFSQCKVQVQGINQQNVVAYVGPYSNDDAARAGVLAGELDVALLSPSANALGLNKDHQKTLLRLKPSFEQDIRAMVAFLNNRRASFVMVVYSPDMEEEYKMLKSLIDGQNTASNVCHELGIMLESEAKIDEVAASLDLYSNGKYVIPLISASIANKLMERTNNNGNLNLVYILDSNIGRNGMLKTDYAVVVEQDISLAELNNFNTFLKRINTNATQFSTLNGAVVNPWMSELATVSFPDLEADSTPSTMKMEALRTIEAVKLIIDGIDQGIKTECSAFGANYQFCDELRNLPGHEDKIFRSIRANHFGDDRQVKLSETTYNYYVYEGTSKDYTKVGTYSAGTGSIDIPGNLENAGYGFAFSANVCPDTLACCTPPTTEPPTMQTTEAQTAAPVTKSTSDNVMVSYPKGKEITGAFFKQDRPNEEYGTRFDLGHKWIIAIGVLAGLGIVCVIVFEIYILYKMVGKKVDNKWRTMWLGQLLLFGIFLAYLVCFAYLWIPTKATCGITRFGVGVAYAICFAVLLVKLMVILTSKTSEMLMPGDMDSPNYLKGVYQFLMFVFAVGVQVVINVQWLITVPPEAIKVMSNGGKHVWVCNHYTWETGKEMLDMSTFVRTNFENHLLSLTYIMVMILIITILSLNAHGIITNHRESVFIGISAGFSIPLWLAWGLVGGLNKENDSGHEFGDACVAFGLLCTATLILFAMFLPKVRQLVNMGVEGIYLEDDRDTIYGGSIIMAPPSYKSKNGPSSVIYVNNQGIYSEPVVVANGDSLVPTHLKHPMSTYSAPPTYLKKSESTYGGSRILRVTDDLKGRHPNKSIKKPISEVNYSQSSGRPQSSLKGTLPRSRSHSELGAL